MDFSRAYPIICIALVLVIGVNAAIFAAFYRRNHHETGQIDLLRQAIQRSRRPWQPEDDSLAELNRRVQALKHPPDKPES